MENVDSNILIVDFHFHLFRFGKDGYGRRRRVNAPLRFGLRNPLNAVPAAFELEFAVTAFAVDAENDFFKAADFGRTHRHQLDFPTATFAVTLVHFVKVAGEKGRFVAAGSGVNFENAVRAVRVRAADGEVEQLVPVGFALFAETRKLHFGEFAHFRVGAFEHFLRLFDFGVELFETAVFAAKFRQRTVFARNGGESAGVGQHFLVVHEAFKLFKSSEFFVE